MNNSWYRVRPSLITDSETKQPAIYFRHPVAPGQAEGGWMTPNKEDELASQSDNSSGKTFSIEEIEKHNKKDDAWLILDGKVYDVTSVLEWHPGAVAFWNSHRTMTDTLTHAHNRRGQRHPRIRR